jgi:cell division protein FtsL
MTPPAAAAAPAVRPRRAPAPRGPRRVSGPVGRAPSIAPRRSTRPGAARSVNGFALGLISAVEALAQHRLLDRLIRGRMWIAIVAFALIGIVALQLGLLKLNGGIGRALEREALLQRQNAALSIENSELAAGPRVEALAAQLGMAFASPSQLRFLDSHPRADTARAAASLAAAARAAAQPTSEAASSGAVAPESSPSGASEPASSQASSSQSSTSESSASESGEASTAESNGSQARGEASRTTETPRESEPSSAGEGESHVAEAQPSGGTQPSAGG